jgi:outer membrane protein
MKNILLPLNVVLAVAVAVLFFLHFKSSKSPVASAASDAKGAQSLKIAYVDLDSIQEKYVYYKEKMTEFERKKESADRELNTAFQRIENERATFAQRGEAITQAEAENFQREYTRKMQNLESQKRTFENNIQQDGMKTMEDLRKRINDFLVDYNKTQSYSLIFSTSSSVNVLFHKDSTLDITNDIVAGLNAAYNKSKTN